MGIGLALFFVICGVLDLPSGHARLIGGRNGDMEFTGDAAIALAIAYIAMGAFFHFHWFWGLSETLYPYCQHLKTIALLVFLPCFLFAFYIYFGLDVKAGPHRHGTPAPQLRHS